ncbi:hypothetical protein [Streptomonospora arabica]|uniref:hypothetical protein n=1 Tax=Streptomonospora arabica TaxID=412417 RepID=UPI003387AE1A
MDYVKGIVSLLGVEGRDGPVRDREPRTRPAGGFPAGYSRLVEELGGFTVDGVLTVLPPEGVLHYERSHDARLAGTDKRVDIDGGYAVKLGERMGDEHVDHDRMQLWAEVARDSGWRVFWEYSDPATRIVVTDYLEYFVYRMEPDEFTYKLLTREISCRPLIDADWPGERFDVAFL